MVQNRVEIEKFFSVNKCKQNKTKKIYVYGDNLVGRGKGGQAVIRGESNAYGVPTKRLPTMNGDAFFSDTKEEFIAIQESLRILQHRFVTEPDLIIVFPEEGLGTGRARMRKKSPRLYKAMNKFIKEHFGIEY